MYYGIIISKNGKPIHVQTDTNKHKDNPDHRWFYESDHAGMTDLAVRKEAKKLGVTHCTIMPDSCFI